MTRLTTEQWKKFAAIQSAAVSIAKLSCMPDIPARVYLDVVSEPSETKRATIIKRWLKARKS